jgi:hypothetical protein
VGLNRIGDHHEYLHRAIGQIMLASGGKKYISPFDLELCLAFPTAPELLAILEALKGLNGIQVEPRELPEGCGPKRLRVWPDGHPRHGLRLDLGLAIEPCQQLLIPYTVLSWRRGFLGRAQEPSRRFAEEVAQGLVGAGGQRIETTIQRPAHWPQVDLPERSPVP